VGYTAISGAFRRGKKFMDSHGKLEERVKKTINEI
jgi:hypothetical protein